MVRYATWEVYYPQGLSPAYNGVQQYGKPITEQYKRILSWGGKIDGKGGSSGVSSGSSSGGSPLDLIKKAFESFLNKLEESMKWDLHSIGTDKFFQIRCLRLQKLIIIPIV
nr:hypothetical protein CoNPh37_CDS0125 [Staphylococcus phage S-CoN_Ph37]